MSKKAIALLAVLLVAAAVSVALIWQPWKPGRKSAENSKLGVVCKAGNCVSVEEAAEKGDRDAQFAVGVAHMNGKGLPRDDAAAVRWFGKAGAQGHRDAQFFFGMAHLQGIGGLTADPGEAAKWFVKSSEQGNPSAQHLLGALHYEGKGVKQDYAESERLWRLSGEQGNAGSQFNIGALYFEARGVPKNDNEALKWLSAAAERGHEGAPGLLAKLEYQWPADRGKIEERLAAATDLVKRPAAPSAAMLKWRAEERQKAEALALKGPNAMDDTGKTALYYAVSAADLSLVSALIEKGGDPNGRKDDDYSWAPLHAASAGGHLEIARLLVDRGARIDLKARNVPSPLSLAVGNSQLELAEWLIAKGADAKQQDAESGRTLLHGIASESDSREVVELLLRSGVDPNLKDREGKTPLHIAASTTETRRTPTPLGKLPAPPYGRKAEIVEALLKGGADPAIQDGAMMTPLEHALNAQSSKDVPQSARQRFVDIENLLRAKPKPPA